MKSTNKEETKGFVAEELTDDELGEVAGGRTLALGITPTKLTATTVKKGSGTSTSTKTRTSMINTKLV